MTVKTAFLASMCWLALAATRPARAVEFWSVDLQATGSTLFGQSNPPLTAAGADPTFNLGNVWNAYTVPAHDLPAALVPAINLADRDGAASSVTFGISVPIAGWGGAGAAGGANDLFRDYIFAAAGNSPVTADFVIGGLTPGASYDMINFGGIGRDSAVTLDFNGNGDLADETGRIAPVNNGAAFRGIMASAAGQIVGRVANGTGDPEGNWAGFHLMSAAPPGAKLWSVDIHGAGSDLFGQDVAPQSMTGLETQYGLGNVWNHVAVPGYDLDPAAVSSPLVDSEGNPTGVEFNIVDAVQGWGGDPGMGTDPLRRDYLFVQAGRSPASAEWTITGLTPGHTYELFAYSGAARDVMLGVDQTGEQFNFRGGHLFGNVAVDGSGMISGLVSSAAGEANWSGFQLRDVTPIPEPSTMALVLVGAAATATIARRRRV
ncbi:MAG: PEP-CTERM sorting domain-containing protein [Pirellulales bacterium]